MIFLHSPGAKKVSTDVTDEHPEIIRAIIEVIEQHRDAQPRGRALEEMAREWIAAGFEDAEEIADWLSARCLTAAGAQTLERAGLTPEQAALRTTAGARGVEDTIGFKLLAGDLSLDEARRIITSHFWNS